MMLSFHLPLPSRSPKCGERRRRDCPSSAEGASNKSYLSKPRSGLREARSAEGGSRGRSPLHGREAARGSGVSPARRSRGPAQRADERSESPSEARVPSSAERSEACERRRREPQKNLETIFIGEGS